MMISRRTFLLEMRKGVILIATYPLLNSDWVTAANLEPTPANTEGPYYLQGAPWKTDLRESGDKGTPLTVTGSLIDTSERTIPDGVVDVWHTDPEGNYDLEGYRYRGRVRASKDGKYRFETFMPAAYGGRPRHIHYKIFAQGFEELTTQLYFENDPFFKGKVDDNLRKDPLVRYRQLIQPVVPFREGNSVAVDFKICLATA